MKIYVVIGVKDRGTEHERVTVEGGFTEYELADNFKFCQEVCSKAKERSDSISIVPVDIPNSETRYELASLLDI